jgi:acetyl-CoA synthetase
VLSPLAGVTPVKPGSCCLPFPGMDLCILDPVSGVEVCGPGPAKGVLAIRKPWPSMARTVWGEHDRFMDVYLRPYPGYYFTGDGAERDADGYYWVKGRVDDVINVSGHRLSTAEIEAALLEHPDVGEAAAIGVQDDMTGQAVKAFVTPLNLDLAEERVSVLEESLVAHVGACIGRFAMPKNIIITPCLPKTRSGKIMRRVLRKIVAGEEDTLGDTTTLSDPSTVDQLIRAVHVHQEIQRRKD